MSCESLTNTNDLVAYLDGELPTEAAARVDAHLSSCAACAREAELLGLAGDAVAQLPRHDPGPEFPARVVAAAGEAKRTDEPRGRLLRLWPAVAAAAVLVAALAARTMIGRTSMGVGGETEHVLTAADERDIAADLYVLTNLASLESVEPDELISLVEELDLLEGLEPELSGLYAAVDEEDGG